MVFIEPNLFPLLRGLDNIIRCFISQLELLQSLNNRIPYLQNDPVSMFRGISENPLSHYLLPLSQGHIVQSSLVNGKSQF